jgi:hypothetical protein
MGGGQHLPIDNPQVLTALLAVSGHHETRLYLSRAANRANHFNLVLRQSGFLFLT